MQNSKKTLAELREALVSNKDDTSTIISELGIVYEQVKSLSERARLLEAMSKRANIAVEIIIPITTVPMIVSGAVLMATNNDYGKPLLYTGVGLLVGCEVVWNSGHFIFHIW